MKRIDWSSLDANGRREALARPRRRTESDVVEDGAHAVGHLRFGAAGGAGKRGALAGVVQRGPVETLHHIIFSIGRTRMAEAPTAFSFSSVSQKTAS